MTNTDMLILLALAVAFMTVMVLKTHVSLMILAGCAGFVLSLFWSPTLYDLIIRLAPGLDDANLQSFISIFIFLLPSLLVTYHFRNSQSHRLLKQVLPALFWAVFVGTLSVHLLPTGLKAEFIANSKLAFLSQSYLSWIVLLAVIIAMVEFMSQHSVFSHKRRGRPPKH